MTKWDDWCNMWWCIGWRGLASRSNYNVEDVLDLVASLTYRVRRLETNASRSPFSTLFGWL